MSPETTYTHGHHESVLRSHRWRSAENSAGYLLAHLAPGQDLLDVGCGPGTITRDLARRVAPGRVVGVDASAEVVELARRDAVADDLGNVRFEVADVYALPFGDGAFAVVHAHQLLQHLSDPVAALKEMRRVCASGGIVAARDADYATKAWYPPDPAFTRWLELYHAVARGNGAEPDAGRRLLAWAHAAGFGEVHASASAWCFATAQEREWWGTSWAERVLSSSFARQALERGLTSRAELESIADAWRRWSADEDGWYATLNGEVICRP